MTQGSNIVLRRVTRRAYLPLVLATGAAVAVLTVAAAAPAQPESSAVTASPQVALDWNATAVATTIAAGKPQAESQLYVGFAQAAVYDAVVAVEGGYEPHLIVPGVPPGSSAEAAAAAAAYGVLVSYFPAQKPMLDAAYAASLDAIPDGPAEDRGGSSGSRSRPGSWRRGSTTVATPLFHSTRRLHRERGGRRRPASCPRCTRGWA